MEPPGQKRRAGARLQGAASSFVRLPSDRRMLVSKIPGRRLPAEGWGLGCLAADIRPGLRRNVLLGVRLIAVIHALMVVGDRDAGLLLRAPVFPQTRLLL